MEIPEGVWVPPDVKWYPSKTVCRTLFKEYLRLVIIAMFYAAESNDDQADKYNEDAAEIWYKLTEAEKDSICNHAVFESDCEVLDWYLELYGGK